MASELRFAFTMDGCTPVRRCLVFTCSDLRLAISCQLNIKSLSVTSYQSIAIASEVQSSGEWI